VSRVFRRLIAPSLFVLGLAAGSASAQSPGWYAAGRLSWVSSGTTSGELGDKGSALKLRSGLGAEINGTLLFSGNFAVEFSAGASVAELTFDGGDWSGIDAGGLWLVPLTAVVQYHFPVYGQWDPYGGLGLTWIMPVYRQPNAVTEAGIQELEFEGELGPAAQLGVNYHMDHRWYANIDLRYLGSSLDARVRTDEGDLPPVTLNVKPLVISLGFGYKF
jgi:outer membrane protein W